MPFQTYTPLTKSSTTYYNELNTTNLYQTADFGGNVKEITVTNDHASDPVQLSYDGAILEATVRAGETFDLHCPARSSIQYKSTAGTATIRIIAK